MLSTKSRLVRTTIVCLAVFGLAGMVVNKLTKPINSEHSTQYLVASDIRSISRHLEHTVVSDDGIVKTDPVHTSGETRHISTSREVQKLAVKTNPIVSSNPRGPSDNSSKPSGSIDNSSSQTVTIRKFGKVVTGEKHLIVYNRVPKCGSRTMLSLFDSLVKKNRFKRILHSSGIKLPRDAPADFDKRQDILKNRLDRAIGRIGRLPAAVEGHFRYQPVESSKHPIYINVIRDPLSRMVSQYYFLRFGDGQTTDTFVKTELHKNINVAFFNQTFDQCVLAGREECTSARVSSVQTSFFCGTHPKCRVPSEWTLEQAKKRVEEDYLVVGVAEDFDVILNVLEKLVPDLFYGIADEYQKGKSKNKTESTKSIHKIPPSPQVTEIMREKLDMEYKFYDFVKTKFDQLKTDLGLTEPR